MTFCLLMSTAAQFFSPRARRRILVIAIFQFAANILVVLTIDSFLDVVLNYAPVMIFVLVMDLRGPGPRPIVAGILIMALAAAIQSAGLDALSPLDHNGLYHVVCMVGVVFLYAGGAPALKDFVNRQRRPIHAGRPAASAGRPRRSASAGPPPPSHPRPANLAPPDHLRPATLARPTSPRPTTSAQPPSPGEPRPPIL